MKYFRLSTGYHIDLDNILSVTSLAITDPYWPYDDDGVSNVAAYFSIEYKFRDKPIKYRLGLSSVPDGYKFTTTEDYNKAESEKRKFDIDEFTKSYDELLKLWAGV